MKTLVILLCCASVASAAQDESCGDEPKPFICSRADQGASLNWPGKAATFRINDSSVPQGLSAQTVIAVVRASFQSWQDVERSEFQFSYGGRTTQKKIGFDYRFIDENENIVIFQSKWEHDEGIIGLTTATFNSQTGEIFDADIELNAENYDFSTNDADVRTDVQNTVTHEAGHFIGFDHTDKDGSTVQPTCAGTATMSRRAQAGETAKRRIWYTDAVGMRKVYPKGRPAQYCSVEETPVLSDSPEPHISQVSYTLGGCQSGGVPWLSVLAIGAAWRRRRIWSVALLLVCFSASAHAAIQPTSCLTLTNPKPYMCSHIDSDTTASLHWEVGEATYKINTDTLPASLDKQSVIDAVKSSFETWNRIAGTQIALTYGGETTSSLIGHNYLAADRNENVILFQSEWPHTAKEEDKLVIALTTATFNGLTGIIFDADIELNAQYFRFTTADTGVQTDVRNTITHEAGHFIGFDHPDKRGSRIPVECSTPMCMSARASAGETSKRELSATDILGAQQVYPAGHATQYCSAAETPKPATFSPPTVKQTSTSLGSGCQASPTALWSILLLFGLARALKQKRSK